MIVPCPSVKTRRATTFDNQKAFMIVPDRALMLARVVRCPVPLKTDTSSIPQTGTQNHPSTNVETKAISQAHCYSCWQ